MTNSPITTNPPVAKPVDAATASVDVVEFDSRVNSIRYLVHAVFLAAGSLDDSTDTDAVQAVCQEASKRLDALAGMVDRHGKAVPE